MGFWVDFMWISGSGPSCSTVRSKKWLRDASVGTCCEASSVRCHGEHCGVEKTLMWSLPDGAPLWDSIACLGVTGCK